MGWVERKYVLFLKYALLYMMLVDSFGSPHRVFVLFILFAGTKVPLVCVRAHVYTLF